MVTVFSGDEQSLENYSLVLSALGIDHMVDNSRQRLQVLPDDVPKARYHINAYLEENNNWPPKKTEIPPRNTPDRRPTILVIGLLALFFWVTGPWQEQSLWFLNGTVDSTAILKKHQWWRLVTALTLHADEVHLAANCIIGGFMVLLLSRTAGYGMAWCLLLFAGTLGNFLNIAWRPMEHHSVGFSTAVFAAIGALTGLRLQLQKSKLLRGLLEPLAAGAGLLAFLGTEGVRTDLGAHLFGFFCGICAALLARWSGLIAESHHEGLQRLLFFVALGFLFFCWALALRPENIVLY